MLVGKSFLPLFYRNRLKTSVALHVITQNKKQEHQKKITRTQSQCSTPKSIVLCIILMKSSLAGLKWEACICTRCLSLQLTLNLSFCLACFVSVTGNRMWRRLTHQGFVTGRSPAPDLPDQQRLVSTLRASNGRWLNGTRLETCQTRCHINSLKFPSRQVHRNTLP